MDTPYEMNLLKAFEDEYREIKGIGLIPEREDRFIIADLTFLCFIFAIIFEFKHAIVMQFTFIKSTIYLYSAYSNSFMKTIPTLFTNTPMSNF